jgi:ABC-2 type transport system permease protein
MDRIQVIIEKEWAEVFKNRAILLTVIVMPLVFTILPLGILYFMRSMGSGGDSTDVPAQFALMCGQTLASGDCMQIFLMNEFLIMYMMMPLAIPIAFAAYSIVGEKTTRSLEPLLATPVTTMELLVGKSLAAVIPAILATWGCFLIFIAAAALIGISAAVRGYIMGPIWLGSVFLIGPLMAVASVNLAVIVSSRVSDPRVAEQISSVMIVPLLAVLFGQIAGVIVLNFNFILISALGLVALDAGLVYLGVKLFGRETILTKWR